MGKHSLAKLTLARTAKKVDTYRKSQKNITTPYRLIRKDIYEKKHPGRIARKGMTCKKTTIDGKRIEVVVLRKLPEGEWEMDQEEIQGVMEDEVIDDGEIELRANQADVKYHALAKSTQFTEEEANGYSWHGLQ